MRSKPGQVAVLSLVLILLLAACQPSAGDSLPGSELDGTTWTLTAMNGREPLPGSEITARFMKGEMSGSTGCNNYFYAYDTDQEQLLLDMGGVTEMACSQPEGVMEQESRFLDYLNEVQRFWLARSELQLITRTETTLIFAPRP